MSNSFGIDNLLATGFLSSDFLSDFFPPESFPADLIPADADAFVQAQLDDEPAFLARYLDPAGVTAYLAAESSRDAAFVSALPPAPTDAMAAPERATTTTTTTTTTKDKGVLPREAWPTDIQQRVNNGTGTYYSFSAAPGGINRSTTAHKVPREEVFDNYMSSRVGLQRALGTFVKATQPELQRIVAELEQILGVGFGGRVAVKVQMAAWILEQERPLGWDGVAGPPARITRFDGGGFWGVGSFAGGVFNTWAATRFDVVEEEEDDE